MKKHSNTWTKFQRRCGPGFHHLGLRMPAPPRAIEALDAMKNLGFRSRETVPVLKKLLKMYDDNWEYIEESGYQVLIDSILEVRELKVVSSKMQDATDDNEAEHHRKRLRNVGETDPSPSLISCDDPGEVMLKKPKLEPGLSPEASFQERKLELSPHVDNRGKTIGPVPPQPSPCSDRTEHDFSPLNRRETRASAHACKSTAQEKGEAGSLLTFSRDNQTAGDGLGNLISYEMQKNTMATSTSCKDRDKDRVADDDVPEFAVPIAMILPPNHPVAPGNEAHQHQQSRDDFSVKDIQQVNYVKSLATPNGAHTADKGKGIGDPSSIAIENGKIPGVDSSQEASSTTIDIASSDMGKVKLLFRFSSDGPDVRIPSLDAVIQMVQESCLKRYKILQPDFSLMNVMKEMCQCALELSNEPKNDMQENIGMEGAAVDSAKRSDAQSVLDGCPMNVSLANHAVHGRKVSDTSEKGKELRSPEDSNFSPCGLVVAHLPQIPRDNLRPLHDATDITKGQERVRIPLLNEVSNEKYPSSFHYIPRSIVHLKAYVNISLARVGDEDCCSDCFGDCVAAAIPCACARETGGEFAYTSYGTVKEAILDDCISMNREPQKRHLVYCRDCPSERCKDGAVAEKCKGHLVRKFIKECWSKCGCGMQCKNRVVQRGITCNLQVFFTPEGKGWGLRTLDKLPRGTFVCEYVGEILTNIELYNRRIQSIGNAKHTFAVLLDAEWGSKEVFKDEEALCLDATFYGNVARFVNHRCVDANLVEIPVEVETPDHHYYHIAFFTTREIEQYEELTWDYGIDFHDVGNTVKVFKCRCGSKFCRDMKRSKTRSKALVLR